MSRVSARLARADSAYPHEAPGGPSLTERLAEALGKVGRALHTQSTPGSTSRHGARRRGAAPASYTLTFAVWLSRTASWQLARLHAGTSSTRVATLRRRSIAERRLVTAFVLSLVLVAAVLADARPMEPLGGTSGAGVAENG